MSSPAKTPKSVLWEDGKSERECDCKLINNPQGYADHLKDGTHNDRKTKQKGITQ